MVPPCGHMIKPLHIQDNIVAVGFRGFGIGEEELDPPSKVVFIINYNDDSAGE